MFVVKNDETGKIMGVRLSEDDAFELRDTFEEWEDMVIEWMDTEADVLKSRKGGRRMRFGQAIKKASEGKKIARHGWNGKGMYVYLTEGRLIHIYTWEERLPSQELTETERKRGCVIVKPHLDMMNAQGERIIGWSASQTDMLADDWYVVDEECE